MKKIILLFLLTGLLTACGSSEREPTFVGNKESRVIHRISCPLVKRMNEENKEMFKTYTKAKNQGYKACDECKPDEPKH